MVEFYCDLVKKFKRNVGKPTFTDQFKKITKHYKTWDCSLHTWLLTQSPFTAFQFNCRTVCQASDSMMTLKFSPMCWCLMPMFVCAHRGSTWVFFSSACLWVKSPFSLFHQSRLISFDCFSVVMQCIIRNLSLHASLTWFVLNNSGIFGDDLISKMHQCPLPPPLGLVAPISVYTPVSVYVDTNSCNCHVYTKRR